MISTRLVEWVIDTVVCLTLAKWETVSGQFGGYLRSLVSLVRATPYTENRTGQADLPHPASRTRLHAFTHGTSLPTITSLAREGIQATQATQATQALQRFRSLMRRTNFVRTSESCGGWRT